MRSARTSGFRDEIWVPRDRWVRWRFTESQAEPSKAETETRTWVRGGSLHPAREAALIFSLFLGRARWRCRCTAATLLIEPRSPRYH